MNISLPCTNLKTKTLRIENGILYLKRGQSFTNAMYSLTYFMKGKNYCYYCKKGFPRNHINLDHIYPRCVGGPTIPQNLIPTCHECNNQKAFMTYNQYANYLSIQSESGKVSYRTKIEELVNGYKSIGMFEFPNSWLTPLEVSKIHTDIDFANISSKKYQKIKTHYETYHSFPYPILVDRKLYSLDGFYVLFVAKSNNVDYVPAIIIENVEIRHNS